MPEKVMGYRACVEVSLYFVLAASIFLSPLPLQAQVSNSPDVSFPKAAAMLMIEEGGFSPGGQSYTQIIADTGVQVVWHAYYLVPGSGAFGLRQLKMLISYTKAVMPNVLLQGAVDAYDFCSVTGQPDPDAIYNTRTSGYHMGYAGCWPLDIAKPKARQYVIDDADKLMSVGVDMIHFDCVDCLPGAYRLDVNLYISAWKQIAAAVRDLAANKYHRKVLLSVNTSVGIDGSLYAVFPDQDYFDLGLAGKDYSRMIQSRNVRLNLDRVKAQISEAYGGNIPPLFLFIDQGNPEIVDPIQGLSRLSVPDQVNTLTTIFTLASAAHISFIFPIETGEYDAVGTGTYGAIKRLMNSVSPPHIIPTTTTSSLLLSGTSVSPSVNQSVSVQSIVVSERPDVTPIFLGVLAIAAVGAASLLLLKKRWSSGQT